MFKFSHLLVGAAVVAAGGAAWANPNMPQRAKTLRVELVRAYGSCSKSSVNDGILNTDIGACTTTEILPTYKFGSRGHGSVRALVAATGDSVDLRVDLTDVQYASGKPADKDASLALEFTYRMTSNHCDHGPVCTATDITNHVLTQCRNGSCHGHQRVGLAVVGDETFPISIEIEPMKVIDPTVTDPAQNVFAVQGIIARNSGN